VDQQPERSGWRVEDGKWTALDVRQMAESKALLPLIVFANACQSGRTEDWGKEEHLYGLARAYLLAGVQHYIGTLWDILDVPGSEFAAVFYDSLLEGQTIGTAIREARRKMSQSHGEKSLIWASYVLYGDPTAQVFGIPDLPEATAPSQTLATAPVTEQDHPKPAPLSVGGETRSQQQAPSKWKALVGVGVVIAILLGLWAALRDAPAPKPPTSRPVGATQTLLDELSSRTRDPEYQKRLQDQDDWTSRRLSVALLPLSSESDSADAVAVAEMLRAGLEQQFGTGRGVQVLERRQLESILAEQNLGASSLADPETLARLGRLRFARLLLSGKVFADPSTGTFLSYSLFDCETTETVATGMVGGASDPADITRAVAERSFTNLAEKYPIRGRVLQIEDNRLFLNIGSDVGVQKEQSFRILSDPQQRGTQMVDLMQEMAQGTIEEVAPGASIGVLQSDGTSLHEGIRVEIKERRRI
ncbi:MAG TPA: CHAT domain-containing protein, partial [bacterium]|nr:CHAT domain-containing protein [bacterium]